MDNHLQTINIEEQRTVAKPIERLEEVLLDDSKPNRTTKIGTFANLMVRQAITTFLKDNQDVFEPWRHARNRPFGHGAQVECVALLSTHPTEEAGVCPIMRPSYSGRSPQVTRSKLHQGSLLPRLASKRHDGQESQREMKDVHGLHKPEQSIPQR